MKKLVKGNQRSNIRKHEVVRQRQQTTAYTDLLKNPGCEGAQVSCKLGDEHRQINSRLSCKDGGGDEARDQKERHEVPHQFVRKELHRVEPAFERVHHRAMTAKVCDSLCDDTHAHF